MDDLQGDSRWPALAESLWLGKKATRKVKPEVIRREIWDVLEQEGFPARTLQTLENLQILEK